MFYFFVWVRRINSSRKTSLKKYFGGVICFILKNNKQLLRELFLDGKDMIYFRVNIYNILKSKTVQMKANLN